MLQSPIDDIEVLPGCPVCNMLFTTDRDDQVYCSKKCKKKAKRLRKKIEHEHYCCNCGNIFFSNRPYQLYCSIQCANLALGPRRKQQGIRRRDPRLTKEYRSLQTIVNCARGRAKGKGMEFNLDKEWIIKNSLIEICPYTGCKLTLPIKGKTRYHLCRSLHRINTKKGYTKDNTIVICTWANLSINEFGEEVFFEMCRAVSIFKTLSRKS